jgi:hypothetical protein
MKVARYVLFWLGCYAVLMTRHTALAGQLADWRTSLGSAERRPIQSGDVQLGPTGTLKGQVVDTSGLPVSEMRVVLWSNRQAVAGTQLNARGQFEFGRLEQGLYVISVGDAVGVYRFWEPGAAPPSAGRDLLIFYQGPTVRGQCCPPGECFAWFTKHPLLTASAIAAAIAIPVSLAAKEASPLSP